MLTNSTDQCSDTKNWLPNTTAIYSFSIFLSASDDVFGVHQADNMYRILHSITSYKSYGC